MLLKVRKEYLLVITIDTEGLQSRAGKQSAARLDEAEKAFLEQRRRSLIETISNKLKI